MAMRPLKETIDEAIERRNAARKPDEAEYTLYRLARDAGISDGNLWNIRNSVKYLCIESDGVLEKLCLALQCSPGDLLQIAG